MATHAPITGAPTRAPVILPFPMTPLRRLRMELSRCHNRRMVGRWLARVQHVASGLTRAEYEHLALRGFEHSRALAAAGR